MLKAKLNEYVNEFVKDLEATEDIRIKKELNRLNQYLSPTAQKVFLTHLMGNLLCDLDEMNEEEIDERVAVVLEQFNEFKEEVSQIYTVRVALNDNKKELYRTYKISAAMPLNEFAYMLLASFNAEGEHLFAFKVGKETLDCDLNEEAEEYARDYRLSYLYENQKKKIQLLYDFGEGYAFDIEFKGLERIDIDMDRKPVEVVDGRGKGIIENNITKLLSRLEKQAGKPQKFNASAHEKQIIENVEDIRDCYEFDFDEFEDLFDDDWDEEEILSLNDDEELPF